MGSEEDGLSDRNMDTALTRLMADGKCRLYRDYSFPLEGDGEAFLAISRMVEEQVQRAVWSFLRRHPGVAVWDGNYEVETSRDLVNFGSELMLRGFSYVELKERPDPSYGPGRMK